MFGYIIVNKPELKIKDYDLYHSYYCGLCRALHSGFGRAGQATLSYDMTFLYVLLSGLYEPDEEKGTFNCIVHPLEKQAATANPLAHYCADMNILLSYYNLQDDWIDDHDAKSLAAMKLLKKHIPQLKQEYPRQSKAISTYLTKLHHCEDRKCSDIDKAAGLTGTMLAEIFTPGQDEWAPTLYRLGFFLGKFIYLMDAWEDRESDSKSGSYNIWLNQDHEVTEDEAVSILNMMMGEAALAFEALPVIKNAEILRNIIYSGVWTRFALLKKEAAKKAEKAKETNKTDDATPSAEE